MVKEGDFVYVPKTGYTLEVKGEDFIQQLYMNGGTMVGKYTGIAMAEDAVKNGYGIIVSR